MLLQGDCLKALQNLEANSVDSIVTDPPYGLGFMGKQWDSLPPGQEVFEQCLRVLKPGGHLLCFGGSRTYHRMAVAVEDAGFEIRDQIMWVYGSGFPKSQDISKSVDALDKKEKQRQRSLAFTEWMRGTGLNAQKIDQITGTNMGSHYTTAASQPQVATREHMELLRPHILCDVPDWIERLVNERTVESENFKNREVVAEKRQRANNTSNSNAAMNASAGPTEKVTNPATEAAHQWEGYGTALKPAHEPIVLARKPVEKGLSIAQNCIMWGVGAINVDGCRVESGSRPLIKSESEKAKNDYGNGLNGSKADGETTQGRFPANLCHDGSPEVVGLFPVTKSAGSKRDASEGTHRGYHDGATNFQGSPAMRFGDTGSAARFFYTAKTKKKERLSFNNHPTVKPVRLMQYLVRLITPAGGTCLDPFAGSGTTGLACMKEGRGYILIDADSQSLDIARRRLLSEIASQEWPLRNYDLL